jgi:hypothetical protein
MPSINSISISDNSLQIMYKGGGPTPPPPQPCVGVPGLIIQNKGLQYIMEYLDTTFVTASNIEKSYQMAASIYKGNNDDPTHPTLDGRTVEKKMYTFKLDVLEEGVAAIRPEYQTESVKGDTHYATNIITGYGVTFPNKFYKDTFIKTVTDYPLLKIDYIGEKGGNKNSTVTKGTPTEYNLFYYLSSTLSFPLECFVTASFDIRYQWGLERANSQSEDGALYNVYTINTLLNNPPGFADSCGDNGYLALLDSISSFEADLPYLSDHANGVVTNECITAFDNKGDLIFPLNLTYTGDFWDKANKDFDGVFNLGQLKNNPPGTTPGFPEYNYDYAQAGDDIQYFSSLSNFYVGLKVDANILANKADDSYNINFGINTYIARTYTTKATDSEFTCRYKIKPYASPSIVVKGQIQKIIYGGNETEYIGKGDPFIFNGVQNKEQIVKVNFTTPPPYIYTPSDFIVYPSVIRSIDANIDILINALNNVDKASLNYTAAGGTSTDKSLVSFDVNGNKNSYICKDAFFPGCDGGMPMWSNIRTEIWASCNNVGPSQRDINYGMVQTSPIDKDGINSFGHVEGTTDHIFLVNQVMISRLHITADIKLFTSAEIYIGLDDDINTKYDDDDDINLTVAIVNIDYPWQTEIQYNEWGKYLHLWGYRGILAVPVGSYNEEVTKANQTYNSRPVDQYTGFSTEYKLSPSKLRRDKFTSITIPFDKTKIYDKNIFVKDNANTFLLLSSDQPLRYRTYVRWGKDSDISILNYFSNPTKPISETYGLYQSYLKQSTGGPQEMVKISPYKADNLATKYTDIGPLGVRNKFGFYQTFGDVPILGKTFGQKGQDHAQNLFKWACIQTPHIWETDVVATSACCTATASQGATDCNGCSVPGTDSYSKDKGTFNAWKDEYYLQPDKGQFDNGKGGCFAVGLSLKKGVAPHYSGCYNYCIGTQEVIWNEGDTKGELCNKTTGGGGATCTWCNPPQSTKDNPPKKFIQDLPLCSTCQWFADRHVPGGVDPALGQQSNLTYGMSFPLSTETLGGFLPVANMLDGMSLYAVLHTETNLEFDVHAPLLYNLPPPEWGNRVIPELNTPIIIFNGQTGDILPAYGDKGNAKIDINLYYVIQNKDTTQPPPSINASNIITSIRTFYPIYTGTFTGNQDISTPAHNTTQILVQNLGKFVINNSSNIVGNDSIAYSYVLKDVNIELPSLKNTYTANINIQITYNNGNKNITTNALILLKNQYELGFYNFHPIVNDKLLECFWNLYSFSLCSLFAIIPSDDWYASNNAEDNIQLLLASGSSQAGGNDAWNTNKIPSTGDVTGTARTYISHFHSNKDLEIPNNFLTKKRDHPSGGGMCGITLGGSANAYSIPKWAKKMMDKQDGIKDFVEQFLVYYNINYIEFDHETTWYDISMVSDTSYLFQWITQLQHYLKISELPQIRIFFGASAPYNVGDCNANMPSQLNDLNYIRSNQINFIIYTYTSQCTYPGNIQCGSNWWWQFTEKVIKNPNWSDADFKKFKQERIYFAVDIETTENCVITNDQSRIACQKMMSKNIQNNYAGLFIWASNDTFPGDQNPPKADCTNTPVVAGSNYYAYEAFKDFVTCWDDAYKGDITNGDAIYKSCNSYTGSPKHDYSISKG